MNAIAILLVVAGGVVIPELPSDVKLYEVALTRKVAVRTDDREARPVGSADKFVGYERKVEDANTRTDRKTGKTEARRTFVLDEPFKEGLGIRVSQMIVEVWESEVKAESPCLSDDTVRRKRWVKKFATLNYDERPTPDGPEFFLRTELALADHALAAAQTVADATPPPLPLPEEPEFDGSPDSPTAEADPPGFIRLWGPEIFLFVFTAVLVAYLVKTFLLKETEGGD
jgi:hypothetical protein